MYGSKFEVANEAEEQANVWVVNPVNSANIELTDSTFAELTNFGENCTSDCSVTFIQESSFYDFDAGFWVKMDLEHCAECHENFNLSWLSEDNVGIVYCREERICTMCKEKMQEDDELLSDFPIMWEMIPDDLA